MAPGSCLSLGSSVESEEEKESIHLLSEQHKELGLHWKGACFPASKGTNPQACYRLPIPPFCCREFDSVPGWQSTS